MINRWRHGIVIMNVAYFYTHIVDVDVDVLHFSILRCRSCTLLYLFYKW